MNERRQEKWIGVLKHELAEIRLRRIDIEQAAYILFYQVLVKVLEEERDIRTRLELIPGGKGH